YEAVAYPLTLSFAAQLSAGGAAGAAAPPESPEAAESPAGTVPAAESPGAKPRGAPWAESAWALAQRAGDATSAKPSINMPMRDIEPPGVEGRGRPGRQRNALARGGARAATRSSGALRRGWAGDPVTAALRGQAAAQPRQAVVSAIPDGRRGAAGARHGLSRCGRPTIHVGTHPVKRFLPIMHR